MKLILDTENSHPTTITVKGKEITLLLTILLKRFPKKSTKATVHRENSKEIL